MTAAWTPGIGDPTPAGWITVADYFLAAALCYKAHRRAREAVAPRGRRREAFVWLVLASSLVFLGINKQLDLQSLATQLLRENAVEFGWYDQRRRYQRLATGLLLVSGSVVIVVLTWWSRTAHASMRLAMVGLAFIATFVLIRAASFHHVDALLGLTLSGVRINSALELTGITTVAAAALWYYRVPASGT